MPPRRRLNLGRAEWVVVVLVVVSPAAAVEPPCGDDPWGSAADAVAIEDALIDGTPSEARAAILAARRTRGIEIGCPEAVFERQSADTRAPSLNEVRTVWRNIHVPSIGDVSACPPVGRTGPAAGLGAWLAGLAGELVDTTVLGDLVIAARWVQAGGHTLPQGFDSWPGLFGIGVWKLARPDGLDKPMWEDALWTLWNTGYFNQQGERATANAGLTLVVRAGVPWMPLRQRVLETPPRVTSGRRVPDP